MLENEVGEAKWRKQSKKSFFLKVFQIGFMFDIIHVECMWVHWKHYGRFRAHMDAYYDIFKDFGKKFFSPPRPKKAKKRHFGSEQAIVFLNKKFFEVLREKKHFFLEESY